MQHRKLSSNNPALLLLKHFTVIHTLNWFFSPNNSSLDTWDLILNWMTYRTYMKLFTSNPGRTFQSDSILTEWSVMFVKGTAVRFSGENMTQSKSLVCKDYVNCGRQQLFTLKTVYEKKQKIYLSWVNIFLFRILVTRAFFCSVSSICRESYSPPGQISEVISLCITEVWVSFTC